MEKAKRYLIFLLGLFLSSLGVSLVTKADLGTSPISAIPYVLSLKFPLTLGQFTIAFSLLLIFLQLLILRRRFRLEHLLQIPISIAFGYFIDLTMGLLFFVSPGSYPEKVLYLLVGCAVLAFGVYLEVLADVAMLPGESFVRAVVLTWNTDFGITKVCFDVSMTAIAVAASLILSGRLAGVREGTLVAALLVGFLARTFGRLLSFLPGLLFPPQEEDAPKPAAGRGYVIAIGRQYGSGGRIIGRLLADRLNYQFYDEEIIQLTAGTTGFTPQFVHQQEESMTSPLLYDFTNQMYYAPEQEAPKDALFAAEKQTILSLAAQGNCVLVGRCADWLLRNDPHCLRVWLHADKEARLHRIMDTYGLDEETAHAQIEQGDRKRATNYQYYTREIWGHAKNFHLAIDTTFGDDYALDMILSALHALQNSQQLEQV